MKNLFLSLLSFTLVGCSEKSVFTPEPLSTPTSVVFVHNVKDQILSGCSVGYYVDGSYNKVGDLGDLIPRKYSDEITFPNEFGDEIFLFTQHPLPKGFAIQKNVKNVIEVSKSDIIAMTSRGNDAGITINGVGYGTVAARYEVEWSSIFNDNIVRIYIDLTDYGGIIIEMSQQLLGRKISIESQNVFWFFSIGDGKKPFQSFQNTDKDFEGYSGWFMVELNAQTSQCLFEFELDYEHNFFAHGKMSDVFGKIKSKS